MWNGLHHPTPHTHVGLSIINDAGWGGEIVASLNNSTKHLTPSDMLFPYKSQIRCQIKYGCHIWVTIVQSSHSTFVRDLRKKNKLLHCFLEMTFSILQPFSQHTQSRKPIATSMTNVSDELRSSVLQSQTFSSKNLLSTSTLLKHHYSSHIHLVRRASNSESFYSRIVSFKNILPSGCFLNTTILSSSSLT